MIKIPYKEMKFHYITCHYDMHLAGTCIYNGKIAKFYTVDPLWDAIDVDPHNIDLYCIVTELPLWKRIGWVVLKQYYKYKYGKRWAY